MPMLTASTISTTPAFLPGSLSNGSNKHTEHGPVRCPMQFRPVKVSRGQIKLSLSCPAGLGTQLSPANKRRPMYASTICSAAFNARCASSSGQTQTVTREAPTITQAPAHEKSPKLDDGGSDLPPGDDGGGGGGGGGGGNWSGGFFLFGFLGFLGFLKDKESEEDYRDSR
ncbi:hypothetical protein CFOL_v3_03180 [Cephalotus follicularis]|uniref:Uncharacterized protein n=1 Tax=Cephalotus follicularis TaxID=3775 RepID=A0A1Q3AVB4_CEPFO|nr:hypothetical protein CFOL_v3_03180 [Cephalotus follicularis]